MVFPKNSRQIKHNLRCGKVTARHPKEPPTEKRRLKWPPCNCSCVPPPCGCSLLILLFFQRRDSFLRPIDLGFPPASEGQELLLTLKVEDRGVKLRSVPIRSR